MNSKEWDGELDRLVNQLEKLEHQYRSRERHEKLILISKKVTNGQIQVNLQQMANKFKSYGEREYIIPEKSKSIVYWTCKIVNQLWLFYQRKGSFLGEAMWFQLVKSRLYGTANPSQYKFDQTDMMELSQRQAELKKSERTLQKQLQQLNNKKAALHTRYDICAAKKNNSMAASSFQGYLGDTKEGYTNNPIIRAMNNYLKWLGNSTKNSSPKEKHLQNMQYQANRQSISLVEACRRLITGSESQARVALGPKALRQLEASLSKTDKLQNHIDMSNERMMDSTSPNLHPIIVKKNQIQDKNMDRRKF